LNKIITGASYEDWLHVTPCLASAYDGIVAGEYFHIIASRKKSRL